MKSADPKGPEPWQDPEIVECFQRVALAMWGLDYDEQRPNLLEMEDREKARPTTSYAYQSEAGFMYRLAGFIAGRARRISEGARVRDTVMQLWSGFMSRDNKALLEECGDQRAFCALQVLYERLGWKERLP